MHAVNEPSPGEAVNAVIQREGGNTHEGQDIWVLLATRRINPGEEVLTWYGPKFTRDYYISLDAEEDFVNGIEQIKDDEDTSEEEETFVDKDIDYEAENYREPNTDELRKRRKDERRASPQHDQRPRATSVAREAADRVAAQTSSFHRKRAQQREVRSPNESSKARDSRREDEPQEIALIVTLQGTCATAVGHLRQIEWEIARTLRVSAEDVEVKDIQEGSVILHVRVKVPPGMDDRKIWERALDTLDREKLAGMHVISVKERISGRATQAGYQRPKRAPTTKEWA